MRKLLWIMLAMALALTLRAEDAYNVNVYEWQAVAGNIVISGNGKTSRASKAWQSAGYELNERVERGEIAAGTEFVVTLSWRGAKWQRVFTARKHDRKGANGELPRGPDKEAEFKRGPLPRTIR
jgi:hypothetical protein